MKQLKTITLTFLVTLVILSTAFAYYYKTNIDEIKKTIKQPVEIINPDTTNAATVASVDEANDQLYRSRRTIITETVEKVNPAIVGINVTEIRQYRLDPLTSFLTGERVYNRKIYPIGSGAIISQDGYILTNDHVAGNAFEAVITMTDGSEYKATIVGTDPASDITLLKINAENLPFIEFGDSDDILIGEWVIALGNPFGLFNVNDKPTVTVGVVSASGMNLGKVNGRYYYDMLQTDAAINGGNSGGALINSIGEMIGMNTLIFTAQGSSGNVGVGFAIPINKIIKVVDELKKHGKVDRDFWTGLQIQMISKSIARYYNLENTKGVIVTNVESGSPSDEAGFEAGDVIVQVNRYRIEDDNALIHLLNNFQSDDILTIEIIREGEKQIKKLKLEKRQ